MPGGQNLGASPDGDRATRPSDQAPSGLGDTASVPSAVRRVGDQFHRTRLTHEVAVELCSADPRLLRRALTVTVIANQGDGLVDTDAVTKLALHAAAKHLEWIDKEHAGPNYYGLTRDTHPEGEVIWRRWWEEQLELCAETERLCREALAAAQVPA